MMLIEETTLPDAAFPLETFRRHLRMGTGFGNSTLQDDLLLGFLRGAVSAIEGRLSKALLVRGFSVTVTDWRRVDRMMFPLAPVTRVDSVTVTNATGAETALDPAAYWLDTGAPDPYLKPAGTSLPVIPARGNVRVSFTAGMAATIDDLPADLKQAVLMLAAHYYEFRDSTGLGEGCMPFGVTSLIQRYRPLRLGVGAGR